MLFMNMCQVRITRSDVYNVKRLFSESLTKKESKKKNERDTKKRHENLRERDFALLMISLSLFLSTFILLSLLC